MEIIMLIVGVAVNIIMLPIIIINFLIHAIVVGVVCVSELISRMFNSSKREDI
jgi:hypothetical protein|nr:MAG TPA: hypothetical protein [Caudoviricetes sp.]